MVTILIKYYFSVFNAHMLIMLQYSISYSKPKPFESQSLLFKRDIELTILYHKKDLLKNNVTSILNQSKQNTSLVNMTKNVSSVSCLNLYD